MWSQTDENLYTLTAQNRRCVWRKDMPFTIFTIGSLRGLFKNLLGYVRSIFRGVGREQISTSCNDL